MTLLKLIKVTLLIAFLTACSGIGSDSMEETESNSEEVNKEIIVNIVKGEPTVTIEESIDGKTTTKTFKGNEAKDYIKEEKLQVDINSETDVEIDKIVKELEIDPSVTVEKIMSSPSLMELDDTTRAKVEQALTEALEDKTELKTEITNKVIINKEESLK